MNKWLATIAALLLGTSAYGATSVGLSVSGVTSNNTYVSNTNLIGAAGETVAVVFYCPTNVTVKIDTVANTGSSFLSRSIVPDTVITNQHYIVLTNIFIANDGLVLSAKSSGNTGTVSTAVKANVIIRER